MVLGCVFYKIVRRFEYRPCFIRFHGLQERFLRQNGPIPTEGVENVLKCTLGLRHGIKGVVAVR